MGKTKTLQRRKTFSLSTQRKKVKRSHLNKEPTEELVLRDNVNVKEYNPTKNLLDTQKLGAAIMECLIENDTDGALEIIEIYLQAVKRTHFLEKANIPRSTAYNFFKRKNPTLKTIAKLLHASAYE
jgi:DNA-binding phage protein